jgi:hypothetical protein
VTKRSLALLLALSACLASTTASYATMSPARAIAQAKAEWVRDMRASAKDGDRSARFPSPSRVVLLRRLRSAAHLYGFRVVSVRLLHPLQSAPVVVISSDAKRSIARATPKIVDLFDPRRPTTADPSGYAYEGYFLVAQTRGGIPYLATFNHWRAPHVGGGEWAANESLYPFPHG